MEQPTEEREIAHLQATRLSAAKTCTRSAAIYKFNAMLTKIPMTFFFKEVEKAMLKFMSNHRPQCGYLRTAGQTLDPRSVLRTARRSYMPGRKNV